MRDIHLQTYQGQWIAHLTMESGLSAPFSLAQSLSEAEVQLLQQLPQSERIKALVPLLHTLITVDTDGLYQNDTLRFSSPEV